MKKVLSLVLAMMLALGLFAGALAEVDYANLKEFKIESVPQEKLDTTLYLGVSVRGLENPYIATIKVGMEMFAKYLDSIGQKYEMQVLDSQGDNDKEVDNMRQFSAKAGGNAIAYSDPNENSIAYSLAEAMAESGGFIGTAWISKALSDAGRSDLAYRLLLNDQYPSWLYAIDQGATSIWERLNGYTVENGFGGNNSMNSFNHYSFGAVGQWMMAYSLGIQRDEPGFRKFILQPEPDPTGTLTSAQGHYDSPYGRIQSAWKLAPGKLTYAATVPPNTVATLYLPTKDPNSVREGQTPANSSQGVKFQKYENGKAVYTLTSGAYTFTATN